MWTIKTSPYGGFLVICSYGVTDIGLRRQMNQDRVYTSDKPIGPLPNLYIVADGMGGHNAGELASAITVRVMEEELSSMHDSTPENALETSIRCANAATWQQAQIREGCKGMGTTVVACTCIGSDLLVANVGDSRLYLCAEGISQVTVDHSLVEEMIQMGGIDRTSARNHPDKNIITRAVGVRSHVEIDLFKTAVKPGDIILLCSDGLTNMLDDMAILEIVRGEGSLKEKTNKLVAIANDNGGRDNISVILVDPFAK